MNDAVGVEIREALERLLRVARDDSLPERTELLQKRSY